MENYGEHRVYIQGDLFFEDLYLRRGGYQSTRAPQLLVSGGCNARSMNTALVLINNFFFWGQGTLRFVFSQGVYEGNARKHKRWAPK